MTGRQVALYFAWSRPDEIAPRLEQFADPADYDQGIEGFLDNIQLANFKLFAELTASWTGNPVRFAERGTEAGPRALDAEFLSGVDTLIIMSFDSSRTE